MPPADDRPLACAALNPSAIAVSRNRPAPNEQANVLSGTMTQMSIERATGDILGVVDCGGVFLRARFSISSAHDLNLYPGLAVYLSFPVSAPTFL